MAAVNCGLIQDRPSEPPSRAPQLLVPSHLAQLVPGTGTTYLGTALPGCAGASNPRYIYKTTRVC